MDFDFLDFEVNPSAEPVSRNQFDQEGSLDQVLQETTNIISEKKTSIFFVPKNSPKKIQRNAIFCLVDYSIWSVPGRAR